MSAGWCYQGGVRYTPQMAGSTHLLAENVALRAQLAAETARVEWLLQEVTVLGRDSIVRIDGVWPIPEGQTARDVIDRLIEEGRDANG